MAMRTKKNLDELDKKILRNLQNDASESLEALGKKVGSSKTPVWSRIKRMIEDKVITKQVVLVDPVAVNRPNTFFVLISTSRHENDWLEQFTRAVLAIPQITEAHRLVGSIDYILKVQLENTEKYDEFYKELVSQVSIFDVTSSLSMETIKYSTAIDF